MGQKFIGSANQSPWNKNHGVLYCTVVKHTQPIMMNVSNEDEEDEEDEAEDGSWPGCQAAPTVLLEIVLQATPHVPIPVPVPAPAPVLFLLTCSMLHTACFMPPVREKALVYRLCAARRTRVTYRPVGVAKYCIYTCAVLSCTARYHAVLRFRLRHPPFPACVPLPLHALHRTALWSGGDGIMVIGSFTLPNHSPIPQPLAVPDKAVCTASVDRSYGVL